MQPSFNGHFNEVRDIDWNHTGDFLVSVSMDQTTRIISYNRETHHYHEISRAQVHGYDINAVSTIKINDGSESFSCFHYQNSENFIETVLGKRATK